MKIAVRVKTKARQKKVEKINAREFILWVREAPKEGRANKAVLEALSDYLGIAKSRLEIVQGEKNKNKVVEII